MLSSLLFAQRTLSRTGRSTAAALKTFAIRSSTRSIASNVQKLKVAWTFDTGDEFKGSEMQCNPIVVDGVLYATTPKLRVIALDAATGKLRWSFDPNDGPQGDARKRATAASRTGQAAPTGASSSCRGNFCTRSTPAPASRSRVRRRRPRRSARRPGPRSEDASPSPPPRPA